ncbi:actin cortical patch SUR7/pH-response regulator pali [Immersiella caudata]|uniref:Actin cortical patch SUR7/pH-response regulator pali n=1 Tax=Immersiella caudata TaxID=314043 RepID=A0AA39XEU9_9PEZI|nr:actin cortical patch SUR7/pH-response regulator pali [Immersiella caudata]
MKRLPIGIPIVASLAAFILILLALLAGSRPGFMEEYDLIAFNTSGLGQNLINIGNDNDEPTPTDSSLCDGIGGFLGRTCTSATAAIDSLQSDIADRVNDIGNEVADELAERLGIHEFYSLHALTICEGDYAPNATTPGADRNVTECHKGFTEGYNISVLLDHGLRVGPYRLTLADLGFTDELQDAIDTLNKVLKAFAALLIVAVGFTGLSMLSSIAALVLIPRHERKAVLINLILAGAALSFMVLSGLVGTITASIATDKVNEKGDDIGLSSSMGKGYLIITWVAVGLMLITFGYWLWQFIRSRNGKTMDPRGPRKYARDSEESGAYGDRPNMRGVQFSRSRR